MLLQKSGLIIGYHGCDQDVRDELITNNTSFKKSENGYDWLGHGMYFWDDDPGRALKFAQFKREHPQKNKQNIQNPSVVGAVIDLGFCLDLINSAALDFLKFAYLTFAKKVASTNGELLTNKPLKGSEDLIFRHLDCAVIETLHDSRQEHNLQPFDSVRGVFWEGNDLYENVGFKERNHIQICVRNIDCIKGFFIPRVSIH